MDIIEWCKAKICAPNAVIEKQGKNWYVKMDGYEITINSKSYTIITVHRGKAL